MDSPTIRHVRAGVEAALRREHEQTQARLLVARQQRAKRDGQGSGPPPFGYRRIWDTGHRDGRIIVDEPQAAIVRRIFALRDQRRTHLQIAEDLEAQGVRTSRGRFFAPSSVQQILQHEALYREGIREWAGVRAALRWPTILV